MYVPEAQSNLCSRGGHALHVRGTRTSLGRAVRTACRGTPGGNARLGLGLGLDVRPDYPTDYRHDGNDAHAALPPLREKEHRLRLGRDVPLREQAAVDLRRHGVAAPGAGRLEVEPGRYRLRTCGHTGSKQPPHWGLCALRFKGATEQAAPPPVDLSTGVAAWRMPKKRGKYPSGAAPKTAPHPLWHKPDHGSWIGSAKEDWPVGPTEFMVRRALTPDP